MKKKKEININFCLEKSVKTYIPVSQLPGSQHVSE